MDNQNQPMQSMPLHNLLSQSVCPTPLVETQILTVTSESTSSTDQSNQVNSYVE